MKIPDESHPIRIAPFAGRVRVTRRGRVIAETTRALALHEAQYPVVYYIPRADTDMAALEVSPHSTHCPYKGDASYFSLAGAGAGGVNAVWSYEAPYPAVADIKAYLAFYRDRFEIEVAGA